MTQALIISFIVLFIHATTWEGHIFEGVKKIIKPEGKLYKPIYGCPICMCPWWGTVLYLILFNESFKDWFITIGAAAGLSVLYVLLIQIKDNSKCAL